jgi:hypothetical protein
MSKQIIILGVSTTPVINAVSAVFWYPITSGKQTVTGVSAWSGASAAENSAIQSGSVLEEQRNFDFPVGLPAATIKSFLLQYWTNRNTQLNGVGPALFSGVYDDSVTGWSA